MDMPEVTLEKKKLSDKVLDQVMDWIMDGKIQMGERLNTDELAKKLHVSRMPVRDAIKEVEKKGLVESIAYKGARLVNLSEDDVRQLYLMRSLLEPTLGYYACRNATEADIDYCTQVITKFEEDVATGTCSAKGLYLNNRSFHFSIYDASHLTMLIDVVNNIWDKLAFYKLIYGQNYIQDAQMMQQQVNDHRLYYTLFQGRKADELKERLYANLLHFEDVMPKLAEEISVHEK